MDAYWGCLCKTKGCNTLNVAHRIGPATQKRYFLPTEGSGWWDFGCMNCGQIHRYTRQDLQAYEVPDPPPGWEPWW